MKRFIGAILLAILPFFVMFVIGYCDKNSRIVSVKETIKDGVEIVKPLNK